MIVIKNPDELIGKSYDADTYHCYSFVSECLEMPSIEDIAIANAKEAIHDNMPFYIQIDEPIDYCLVLLGDKHLGIYYKDMVYHADTKAVKCESMRTIQKKFPKISFWDKEER